LFELKWSFYPGAFFGYIFIFYRFYFIRIWCFFILLFLNFLDRQLILAAEKEAGEIIQEAKSSAHEILEEEKERFVDIEMNLRIKHENDFLKSEEKCEELQEKFSSKQSKFDQMLNQTKIKHEEIQSEVSNKEKNFSLLEKKFSSLKESLNDFSSKMTESILDKLNLKKNDVLEEIVTKLIDEEKSWSHKFLEENDKNLKEHNEVLAKRILAMSIDRFARPYCPERGLGGVGFPNAHSRKNFFQFKEENTRAIQEHCGCDIVLFDDQDLIGISGYDPVRRELTRRVLDKILYENKKITPDLIQKTAQFELKQLFKSIETDGNLLAKELNLQDLHPEVRQMMGALRYRYSFTQNQYFHCSEVGWLAGLLASELNISISKARRCGMLHDIGKSMDHALDGGHAVIGANFIEARGENQEIVHAVRAHHFDVSPDSDFAFLVIAADAISGARPGARRSTIESYNQKVTALQDIARSYKGVTDCIVLNGGRECRIQVDEKRISDLEALELSKKIAKQIEEECSYPGQIKVVLVRATLVSESTRKEYA